MNRTVLVVGGTGMLGQPVCRSLKEAGFRVRIITRDPQKARTVFDDAFEVVGGDPTELGCLEDALAGCYGVHISLPTEVERQAAEAVAKLASKHGVERISYISGATVAEEHRWFPMVDRKFLAEKAIRESGVAYTFFCPTWAMESLALFVVQARAATLGKQPYPYHWVAADDLARMVSSSYGQAEAANQRYIVLGPEAIRIDEALRRYVAVFHPEIMQVSTMPFWLVKLLATVTANRDLKGAGELMSYFDKVGEQSSQAGVNRALTAPTTLDGWLERRWLERSRAGLVNVG